MASSDLFPVDSNTDALPHGVTAPDLFGGELFGDELMDMYNSAAVVEHEMMDNDIPSLLERKTHLGSHQEPNHPVTFAAITVAPDDGFGAFRPSTSFNDLEGLFHPETVNSTGAIVPLATTPVPVAKDAPKKTAGRKRAAVAPDGPATKKRGIGSKVRPAVGSPGRRASAKAGKTSAARTTAAKAGAQSTGQTALKLCKEQPVFLNAQAAKGTNETPNPLSAGSGPRDAWATKAQVSVTPITSNSSVALPVVVSPKTSVGGKGGSITSEAATAAAAAVAAAAAAAVAAAAGTGPIKVVSSGVATEADFKSVAQAAVTNLILNAASQKPDADSKACTDSNACTGKIDTSTEHIKALTSSNWVNACGSGTDDDAASISALGADAKANNRARRQNLTPDERARQNRDRNREHARNTRLRKKAYVEELKRTLTELVSQRDAADLDKRRAAQREIEQREVRFRVMEEFLKLRGRRETNLARWVAILEDNFSLTLPETDYRRTVHESNDATREQLLTGATEVMTDASYVASLLSTLKQDPNSTVSLLYHCERKNFFMDDSVAVLDWSATVVGAYSQECAAKLSFKGLMRAKFSPASNKLVSAELIFDSGGVASQLAAAIKGHTSVTVDKCDEIAAAVAAAQAAANEADALLDSLQMPHLNAVPAAITVMAHTASKEVVSVTCSEKDDTSSDESTAENVGVAARRSTRLKD